MTISEFLESLFTSFVNLPASALLVMLISIAVIVGLLVIWKSWLGRREDRIAAQEERDWDWLEPVERLEPLEREFERKSSLDAVPVLNGVQGNDEPNDAVQDLDEVQAVDAMPVLNEMQGNDEPNDAVQANDEVQAPNASEDIADAFAELRRLLAEAKIPTEENK